MMSLETYYQIVWFVLAGLVGLCVGSFLNVVIYRVPLGMSLSKPASHCPQCGYQLRFYDNIPLVSYALLGGKCRRCKAHISFRYSLVEAANMVLWLLCAWVFEDAPVYAAVAAFVCSVSICIFFIDLEHMLIFDRFQLMLAAAGIAAIFCDPVYDWKSHLIGLAVGGLSFFLIGWLMSLTLGRDALGGGDVKLAAAAGLLLGWQKLILMVLLASVSASVYMLWMKRKTGESRERPFGPFLTAGLVIAMLAGNAILEWYIALLVG